MCRANVKNKRMCRSFYLARLAPRGTWRCRIENKRTGEQSSCQTQFSLKNNFTMCKRILFNKQLFLISKDMMKFYFSANCCYRCEYALCLHVFQQLTHSLKIFFRCTECLQAQQRCGNKKEPSQSLTKQTKDLASSQLKCQYFIF